MKSRYLIEVNLRKKVRGKKRSKDMKRLLLEQAKSRLQAKALEQKKQERRRKTIEKVNVKLDKFKIQLEKLCIMAKEYKYKTEEQEKQELEKVKGIIESYKINANAMREERDKALELVKKNKKTKKIESFICPIFQEVMKDPQMTRDGYTYEGEAIKSWFVNHDTSPMTNLKLYGTKLIPNRALRSAIQELV